MTTGQQEEAQETDVLGLSEATIQEAHSQIERLRLSWDHLKRLLYLLRLCRYFDERMETLYRQGKLPGAIYSGRGQEGTHVGVAFALRPED